MGVRHPGLRASSPRLFSFRTAVVEADSVRRATPATGQFIRRAKAPELPVVLLEDLGALVGLVFALAGVTSAVVTDDGRWDGFGSIAIGILLGIIAIVLVDRDEEPADRRVGHPQGRRGHHAPPSRSSPTSIELIHLRTQHLGPEELLVGAKVEFDHELTVAEVAGRRRPRRAQRSAPACRSARVIYLEPDVHRRHRRRPASSSTRATLDPDDPS